MTTDRGKRVGVALIAVLAPVAVLVVAAAVRGELPNPTASHWDFHGRPNGTASPTALFAVTIAVSGVIAMAVCLLTWLARRPTYLLGPILVGLGWLVALTYTSSVVPARGAAYAAQVHLGWYWILLVLGGALVLGHAAWLLTPEPPDRGTQVGPTPIRLAVGEHVEWIGSAHSAAFRVLSVAALAAAGALALVRWPFAIGCGVLAVLLAGMSLLTVRIDDRGLHTLWSVAGWPRSTIRLDTIVSVRAQTIEPMQWGGWGYRVGRHGVAAVLRRGPGLVIERRGHMPYAVTVDDADEGAALLNALLARSAPS